MDNKTGRSHKKITQEEARYVIKYWDTMTIPELAGKINRPISTVVTISKKLRKAGLTLSPKTTVQAGGDNFYKALADEANAEKGFKDSAVKNTFGQKK